MNEVSLSHKRKNKTNEYYLPILTLTFHTTSFIKIYHYEVL